MLYIITEDKNSARDFWEKVAEIFKGKEQFVMVPLPENQKTNTQNSGNTTLNKQVIDIFPQLNKGDTLFVAFDNIGNTVTFNPVDFLKKTKSRCEKNGILFKYTTYYCFEELYLSYDELLHIKMETNNVVKEYELKTLMYVHECINNNRDYFNNVVEIQKFIDANPDAGKNREHFANQLLMKSTETKSGHFKILKEAGSLKKSGECWIKDCQEIQKNMNKHQIENICKRKCKYCCKNQTAKNKLLDLNYKSLLRKSKMQDYKL